MGINLPIRYTQTDSRWGSIFLGFNSSLPYNIYNFGCLDTSLSMVACYFGKSIDPGQLNELLKQKQGFSIGSGNYIWGSISKVFPDIKETLTNTPSRLTDAQMGEIKSNLDRGLPVIIQLDYNPKTVANETHYVVLVAYNPNDENDFTIADPLNPNLHSLKDYLGWFKPDCRTTINQYICFTGPVPQVVDPNMVTLSKADNDKRTHNSEQWIKIVGYLGITADPTITQSEDAQTVVAGYKSRSTDMENKANKAAQDLAGATQQIENLNGQIGTLNKQLIDDTASYKARLEAINSATPDTSKLVASYEGQITTLRGQLTQSQKDLGDLKVQLTQATSSHQDINTNPSFITNILSSLIKFFLTKK